MRILVTTNELMSHFTPMLPFAKGLRDRGHEVRVAAPPELGEAIALHGFGHLALKGPTDEAREVFNQRAREVPREEMGKFFVSQFFMDLLPRNTLPGLLDELNTWRPDLILRETTEFSGLIAAEKLGIRHARFEVVNGESEESIATNYAAQIDALRALASLDPTHGGYLKAEPAFSAHPKILDDTPRINSQEPYRFRTPTPPAATHPPDWLPPGDRPLIYITFGTMAADEESVSHIYASSLDAAAGLPVNALLTTGPNAPPDLIKTVPDNVTIREFVPQAEVFQHAKLMVCHGGSGTVLGGLAAGIPMIVIPLFADQPDNARCLASAGLCIPVPADNMTSLAPAITNALQNRSMHTRAAQAARDLAALPAVEQALDKLIGG